MTASCCRLLIRAAKIAFPGGCAHDQRVPTYLVEGGCAHDQRVPTYLVEQGKAVIMLDLSSSSKFCA